MSIAALKNGLNNLYADRVSDVGARTIATYGQEHWPTIKSALKKWESEGAIKVLGDPDKMAPDEPCVRLLEFIQ